MTTKHDGWKNNFGTTTFEGFNRKFFGSDKFIFEDRYHYHYFDKRVILKNIRPNVNIELTLSTHGVSGHYEGYRVAVVHNTNGEIASQWFGFKEYLTTGLDQPQGCYSTDHPFIIDHCGIDWYCNGATPKSIKSMIAKINEYIEVYS